MTSLSYSWRKGKHFSRREWLRFSFWFTVIAILWTYLLALPYLSFIQVSELHSYLYLLLAYIGHMAMFPVLFGLLLLPVMAVLLPKRAAMLPVTGLAFLAGLMLLVVDTRVYSQYRFHLSGFVWELLTGPGAGEIIQLSWFTLAAMVLVMVVAVLVTLVSLSLAAAIVKHRRLYGMGKWLFAGWLLALTGAHLTHIWYEAHYDTEITGITRHLPSYYPATAKRRLEKLGFIDPDTVREQQTLAVESGAQALKYPLNPLQCQLPAAPLNVLVIAIDSLRADQFTPDVMPRLSALRQHPEAFWFGDHHSGGNVTKAGIFSLFFGLPATYWDAFASAQSGAAWINQHLTAGYRVGIFSSATLLSPAFDRTVFSQVPELRMRSDGDDPVARDRDVIHDFNRFLDEGASDTPFFSFLFLDAIHGYAVPEGFEKFQPMWERVDHIKLNADFDPVPYFNRYRNAAYFSDYLVAELLQTLEQKGVLQNTLLILTSDHGEAFNDMGKNFWGHGSNFTHYQTQVPLLMLWPGKTGATYDYRTSHYDLAPTVMQEVLGCRNPVADYASGHNLFDSEKARDWLLVHSYFNYGLVLKDRLIATYPTGGYEVLDLQNNRVKNGQLPANIGAGVLQELSRFYR